MFKKVRASDLDLASLGEQMRERKRALAAARPGAASRAAWLRARGVAPRVTEALAVVLEGRRSAASDLELRLPLLAERARASRWSALWKVTISRAVATSKATVAACFSAWFTASFV